MQYEPWMLGMIDEAGLNGIRQEHIDAVARSLLALGLAEIDRHTFESACWENNIDPNCFTQADLNRLEDALN